jgi:hypothetical protein
MKNPRTLLLIIINCLVCWGAYLTPEAKAGEWDRWPILTFSQPVALHHQKPNYPDIVAPSKIELVADLHEKQLEEKMRHYAIKNNCC